MSAGNQNPATPEPATHAATYVYVSGYGNHISLFTLDVKSATLASQGRFAAGEAASYLAIAPDRRRLYAVNETAPSRVIAFSMAAPSGRLTEINRQVTTGDGAPHLAVHPSGGWVVVAHYGSGHISVLPLDERGAAGVPSGTSRGPDGNCRNAHQAVFDGSGKHLFVPCLGSNYVIQFKFDAGVLTYNDPAIVAVAGGPRHMAFHPNQRYAYVLAEHESTLTSFRYDALSGRLSDPASIPSVQKTKGASAHLVVHPSGRFLYASNRTENSVGVFALDSATGRARPVAFETARVSTPRDFTIDPSGQILISANQSGPEDLLLFRIAKEDGRLGFQGSVSVGGRPTFVGIVQLP
jgi:6-phosphogluconolactonase